MKKTFVIAIALFICFGVVSGFAAETVKPQAGQQQGQAVQCPRNITVDVTIKTASQEAGWDSIPARSRFTLAVKESAVRNKAMFCHYSNGTVDYNIHRAFPKGKTCYIAPDQSFMCQ